MVEQQEIGDKDSVSGEAVECQPNVGLACELKLGEAFRVRFEWPPEPVGVLQEVFHHSKGRCRASHSRMNACVCCGWSYVLIFC